MKTTIIIMLVFLFFTSCKSKDRPVEDKLYACLQIEFSDNGIDLDLYLDSLENYLIKNHVLDNPIGSGKINYYKNIVESGDLPSVIYNNDIMDELGKYYPGERFVNECFSNSRNIDTTQLINTNYYKTSERIKAKVLEQNATNVVTVSKAILLNLTEADFNHQFYRAHMLLTYVSICFRNQSYIRTIPKKIQKTEAKGGFLIELSEKDKLFADGQKLKIDQLESELFKYLKSFDEKTYINIKVDPSTHYNYFSEIHLIIEKAYNRLWEQISIEEHEKLFNNLDTEAQNKIQKRYPIRIKESV